MSWRVRAPVAAMLLGLVWSVAAIATTATIAAITDNAPTLPDAKLTPGAVRPGVTAADLCPVAHTPTIRNVPASEKSQVYREYGMAKPHTGYCSGKQGCEVDHLISLELGGSNDIKNLWAQSYGIRQQTPVT
jgi:hypothetical protein